MLNKQPIDADSIRFLSAIIRARPRHPRSIDTPVAAYAPLPPTIALP
ncbi:MAG TPA: hypothetical protein VJ810_21015 [Blastocatellia bacterium]|nr:hypothetical protein [Blastocatellia bacterium]